MIKHLEERRNLLAEHKMKDCPFCGKAVSANDDDTLYPVTRTGNVWGMHCPEPAGGCGAQVVAFSPEEAIAKWNTRKSKFANEFDKGPWVASKSQFSEAGSETVHVMSDDFNFDVALKVCGDFGDPDKKFAYAEALALKLNS